MNWLLDLFTETHIECHLDWVSLTFVEDRRYRRSRFALVLAWYDVWIGAYYNVKQHKLYLMVPFIGISIQLN